MLHRLAYVMWIVVCFFPTAINASSWNPTLLVNTESFVVIDESDSTTNVSLQFGDTLAETLTYNRSSNSFVFSDDLELTGNLTINNANAAQDAVIVFGNDLVAQSVTYSDTFNRFIISDDLQVQGTVSGSLINNRSATPPIACSAAQTGRQWVDSDSGVLYICDTSNGRNKWLSVSEVVLMGEETGSCTAGGDPNSIEGCNAEWGSALGPDTATDLGWYLPYDATIVGYGFSEDNDACTSGSLDVEVWSTASSADDNNYTLAAEVATGLTGQAHSSAALNVDLSGDRYIMWGLDNNCGQTIDDWNVVFYLRWRS